MVEGHRPASTAFDIMCPSTTLRVVPLPVPGRIFLAESIMRAPLPIGRVGGKIRRDRAFPFVAIGEKLGLVIEQLLARFGREFEVRSEEHTSELQSLMRISYAVFCLKNKTKLQATKQLS